MQQCCTIIRQRWYVPNQTSTPARPLLCCLLNLDAVIVVHSSGAGAAGCLLLPLLLLPPATQAVDNTSSDDDERMAAMNLLSFAGFEAPEEQEAEEPDSKSGNTDSSLHATNPLLATHGPLPPAHPQAPLPVVKAVGAPLGRFAAAIPASLSPEEAARLQQLQELVIRSQQESTTAEAIRVAVEKASAACCCTRCWRINLFAQNSKRGHAVPATLLTWWCVLPLPACPLLYLQYLQDKVAESALARQRVMEYSQLLLSEMHRLSRLPAAAQSDLSTMASGSASNVVSPKAEPAPAMPIGSLPPAVATTAVQ